MLGIQHPGQPYLPVLYHETNSLASHPFIIVLILITHSFFFRKLLLCLPPMSLQTQTQKPYSQEGPTPSNAQEINQREVRKEES